MTIDIASAAAGGAITAGLLLIVQLLETALRRKDRD